MWQAPNQRVRSIANAKKREREKNRRMLHLKRVMADIKCLTTNEITQARIVLNEISLKGMSVFCPTPLMVGQEIAVTMNHPVRVYLRGRIVWCQETENEGHIMTQQSFSYRVGVQFTFESAADEEAVKKFVEQLTRDHLITQRAA